MQDLVAITDIDFSGETVNAVDARELYTVLGLKKDFSNWVKSHLEEFVENQDFIVFAQKGENPKGGRPKVEYAFSLEMAKHVAMMTGTEKGKEVRQYFIDFEKKHRQQQENLSPAEFLLEQAKQMVAIEKRQKELEKRQEVVEAKIEDFENGAEHFSITAYNKLYRGEQISHSQANQDGREISRLCKNQGIQLGTAPHPVWGTVNTYPKAMLDAYYNGEIH